jgi:hypothetical protein
MIRDPDAAVRGTALRALVNIRKKLVGANLGPAQNSADGSGEPASSPNPTMS